MKKYLILTLIPLLFVPLASYAWTDKAYVNCDRAVQQKVGQFRRIENTTKAYYPDTAKNDPRFPSDSYFIYSVVTNQGSFNATKCFFNSNTDAVTRVELN